MTAQENAAEKRLYELQERVATFAMMYALRQEVGLDIRADAFEDLGPLADELLELPTKREANDGVSGVHGGARGREQILVGLGLLAQAFELVSSLRREKNVNPDPDDTPRVWKSMHDAEDAILELIADLGRVLVLNGGGDWMVYLEHAERSREQANVAFMIEGEEEWSREPEAVTADG